MYRFIKLSSVIINISHINKITIQNNKYLIHLTPIKYDGFILFAGGAFQTEENGYIICKDKHPNDYKILTDWIKLDIK